MTLKVALGFVWACASSAVGTTALSVPGSDGPPGAATPAAGMAIAVTSARSTTTPPALRWARRPELRPPLPQSAFPRSSELGAGLIQYSLPRLSREAAVAAVGNPEGSAPKPRPVSGTGHPPPGGGAPGSLVQGTPGMST